MKSRCNTSNFDNSTHYFPRVCIFK